ncbi:ABC transporter substrate-binding protein [uncultured Enterovirga sp.]|uniref:ABC transporter substrate-binding protein n=1 Tax=uncultured Enterovirga sp. TaxID=2026352 RepID=UPI0035CC7746
MRTALTRRAAIGAGLASAVLGNEAGAAPGSPGPKRVVALEWSIVSMLLSIGVLPVGIGETGPYRTWVSAPELPPGIVDVGIRNEPSLEALAALRPDLILVSPLSRSIVPLLQAIAPVREIATFTEERAPLRLYERELRALAREFGRAAEAEQVIETSVDLFGRLQARLAPLADRPVLVGNFLDARHIRVFGPGSLFDDVLGRVGLRNAWTRPGNVWGFELAGIEALGAYPDSRIAIVEPVPPDVRLTGSRPSLWTSLAPVRAGRVVVLPPAWPFGDLLAGQRFAAKLAAALDPSGEPVAGR